MRVVMPLFNFQYFDEEDITFSDGRFSIRHFDNWGALTDREIFSQRDRAYISKEIKALVAEGAELRGYELDASLLLLTFRLLAKGNNITPIIKYRLSEDEDLYSRIEETETHIRRPGYLYQVYSPNDFPRIDSIYMLLRNAERTSQRLKNALFFIYRAFNSYHWVDIFLFYMSALEALFSLDGKGPAKKPVCGRTVAILNDHRWDKSKIENLYDVRSRIAHGRVEAGRDSKENLELAANMEVLVKLCLRRLIEVDGLQYYANRDARDKFLDQFKYE